MPRTIEFGGRQRVYLVYATVISNGGFMSQLLGAQLSDRFAAIAPVASGMAPRLAEHFRPNQPVAVFVINGTADPLVPYGGGSIALNRGTTISTGDIVRKLSIEGGGHTWPGGPQYLPQSIIGRTSRDIDATPTIWEFFSAHPRR